MKIRQLVSSLFVGAALMATAEAPTHLYMVGDASRHLWDIDEAVKLRNAGNGKFVFNGPLYTRGFQFIADRKWEANRYVPTVTGWVPRVDETTKEPVAEPAIEVTSSDERKDNVFWINDAGIYDISVTFFDDNSIAVKAKKTADLPWMSVLLGDATKQYDCNYPNPLANLYSTSEEEKIFVWEGKIPAPDPTDTDKKPTHFQFISHPGAASDIHFLVPETTDEGSNIKTVTLGETYPVKRIENPTDNPGLYWNVPDQYCDGETWLRATLYLGKKDTYNENMTFKVETFKPEEEDITPEHLYIVGDASPSLWIIEIAEEMEKVSHGVFKYHGALYRRRLQFITDKDWAATRYVPNVQNRRIILADGNPVDRVVKMERSFDVEEPGTYDITVTITDYGRTVNVKAERVDELHPMVVLLGAASGQWECEWPNPSANIYPDDPVNSPKVFVWEGSLSATDNLAHFKFIPHPGFPDRINFYVPTETDASDGKVKMAELYKTYPVKAVPNTDPSHDTFWGVAEELCDPDIKIRATLDLTDPENMTFSLGRLTPSGIETVESGSATIETRPDGILVDGAKGAVAVYNVAGALVGMSTSGSLHLTNLSKGVYIVKTDTEVHKVSLK